MYTIYLLLLAVFLGDINRSNTLPYSIMLFAMLVLGLWLIRTGWRRRTPRLESPKPSA